MRSDAGRVSTHSHFSSHYSSSVLYPFPLNPPLTLPSHPPSPLPPPLSLRPVNRCPVAAENELVIWSEFWIRLKDAFSVATEMMSSGKFGENHSRRDFAFVTGLCTNRTDPVKREPLLWRWCRSGRARGNHQLRLLCGLRF